MAHVLVCSDGWCAGFCHGPVLQDRATEEQRANGQQREPLCTEPAHWRWAAGLRHQCFWREDLLRLTGFHQVCKVEDSYEALSHLLCPLQHSPDFDLPVLLHDADPPCIHIGRGAEERHEVLQGHRHARPLLHEEDTRPDADGVQVLREQQLQGLV